MQRKHDVVVVGAGPTGIIIVNELLRRGLDVRWVEKRTGPLGTTRAFTVHARTFEMFEHIGIAHRIREVNAFCPGNRFHIEGLGLSEEDMPVLDFRQLKNTRYNFYGKVNQQDLEQILRNHVASQHNFSPEWGVSCKGFSQDESGVCVEIEKAGKIQQIHAGYIVGADGVHSTVRQHIGVEMRGDAYEDEASGDDGYFTMSMMDVPLENYPGDADWINYHFNAFDWMLITSLPDGNYRVYVSGQLEKELQTKGEHSEVFQKGLDRFVPGTRLARRQQATTWKIYKMMADDYSHGRAFLAGDACHVRSPAGGQGANCCMQDAFNLGWKLASVIKGLSPASILQTYATERKPVARQVQGYAERMHDVLFDHSRPLAVRVKETQDLAWHDECINGISGMSHNYVDVLWQPDATHPLQDGPIPGQRAPNARISTAPLIWMHDLYRHPQASLVMLPLDHDELRWCREYCEEILTSFKGSVKPFIIYSEQVEQISPDQLFVNQLDEVQTWYGQDRRGRMFLVRPDLYLGYAAYLQDKVAMEYYLHYWFNSA